MKKLHIITGILTGSFILNLGAATLVQWGSGTDIVTSRQNGVTDNSISGTGDTILDLNTTANVAVGPSYYPNNTGRSPEFYGAAYATWTNGIDSGGSVANYDIEESGGGDHIRMRVQAPDNSYTTAGHLISYWKKDQFLNGLDNSSQDVVLGGMSVSTVDNGGGPVLSRFIIQLDNTQFYASEVSSSFTDPTAISWYDYSPSTDFTTVGPLATLTATDFQKTTGVGVYSVDDTGSRFNVVGQSEFQATGTVLIPEPSSLLLLGLAGFGALIFLKRR